jgi:hypothetical protein
MIQLPTHYEDTTNGTHPVPEAQFAEPAVAHSMSGNVLPIVQTVAQSLNSATLFRQYSKMIPIFCFRAFANLTELVQVHLIRNFVGLRSVHNKAGLWIPQRVLTYKRGTKNSELYSTSLLYSERPDTLRGHGFDIKDDPNMRYGVHK